MPDPNSFASIGWVIVAIAALCVCANQIDDFFKRRAGQDGHRTVGPQPFEVKAAAEFLHKRDHDAHHAWDMTEHNNLFKKIGGVERGAAQALKDDVDSLRDELTEVGKQVAGLNKSTELQNQQLASIVSTQNTILQRLPRNNHA